MGDDDICLFALQSSRACGDRIAAKLGLALASHEERVFEDGEHKSRPLESVRGRDVYVIQSLYADAEHSVDEKLCRLLFFIGALRDAAAGRITAVIPYLCYARKDRKTKPRDPVTTRYVATLFEAVGVDRVVTMDVHNLAAFQNAFRCATEHLEARRLLAGALTPLLDESPIIVLSPDEGGIKRTETFQRTLAETTRRDVALGFMEKHRSEDVVTGESLYADVRDRTAIIIDDLISTGTTLLRTARAARAHGARGVHATASHGLFRHDMLSILADPAFTHILVTDSVPAPPLDPASALREKLLAVDTTELFAQAIRRLHENGSLIDLLDPGDMN